MKDFEIFYLLSVDGLFGGLEEFLHYLVRLKGDEAESLSLVLYLVKGHFNFHDGAEV